MTISLDHIWKRYNYDWIFRKLDFSFEIGISYAILGPNGSGKSTLLQVIAGSLSYNEGMISYFFEGKEIAKEQVFRYLSLSAPYLELVEEFTLKELLQFHQRFNPFMNGFSLEEIMAAVQLKNAAHKQIRYYSSGMKQRAKLGQAIFSDSPVLLLDEPCTNLDEAGVQLYQHLMKKYIYNKLVIISSNDPQEYGWCEQVLSVTDYK
jgi:ABC-type multidrug transport system ATPase subunit